MLHAFVPCTLEPLVVEEDTHTYTVEVVRLPPDTDPKTSDTGTDNQFLAGMWMSIAALEARSHEKTKALLEAERVKKGVIKAQLMEAIADKLAAKEAMAKQHAADQATIKALQQELARREADLQLTELSLASAYRREATLRSNNVRKGQVAREEKGKQGPVSCMAVRPATQSHLMVRPTPTPTFGALRML